MRLRTRWVLAAALVLAACSTGGETTAPPGEIVVKGAGTEQGASGAEPEGEGAEGASGGASTGGAVGDGKGGEGGIGGPTPGAGEGSEKPGERARKPGEETQPGDVAQPGEPKQPGEPTEPGEPTQPGQPAEGLIAHEWGTFTSMQGSDGAPLLGMHHEEEPLPDFVVSRSGLFMQQKGIEELPEGVDQKLETPVIYFYTGAKVDVTVDVAFPKGIIGQWFPDATTWGPALGAMEEVGGGSMTWQVTVDPAIDAGKFPPVDPQDIWAPSRATAATPLRYGAQHERFIFYRGLGRFDMPVRVTSDAGGTVTVTNESGDLIPSVILLSTDGATGAVADLGALGAGQSTSHAATVGEACADWLACVRPVVVDALVKSGLYEDEAWAMVDTWTRSYFQTPGLRVLYVVPRPWTDALLPIKITPEPTALVRTLVGRIEVLTPAEEASLVAQVSSMVGKGDLLVAQLGRFAEPRLRRACALIQDEKVTQWCDGLLVSLSLQP
ncbi:MAG: hypothetical protein AMXMBFR64_15370 [Myxococcales bacterium]